MLRNTVSVKEVTMSQRQHNRELTQLSWGASEREAMEVSIWVMDVVSELYPCKTIIYSTASQK